MPTPPPPPLSLPPGGGLGDHHLVTVPPGGGGGTVFPGVGKDKGGGGGYVEATPGAGCVNFLHRGFWRFFFPLSHLCAMCAA